ncbi:hypothetical protein B0J12DRAFT_693117 [Macrophomina phaseolina]|uniref:Uncharacterized protein n=1 Tax=Macrophomina phaseolina TaxID=35725 RepID=A0ABQ8GUD4_9PEZI|nr:hypothetical protein B0J12DRAFT_693117 [Macrophomina phaseolina]
MCTEAHRRHLSIAFSSDACISEITTCIRPSSPRVPVAVIMPSASLPHSPPHSPVSSASSLANMPWAGSSTPLSATTPGMTLQPPLHKTAADPKKENEPMTGVLFAAIQQGSVPLPVRTHRMNRFGLHPPPPTQHGRVNRHEHLDLVAVNVGLIGAPTIAPENTPAASNAPSDRTSSAPRLPTIAEALERLPDLSSDVSAATTLAEIPAHDEDGNFLYSSLMPPSSPAAISRSSTPISQHGVREHSDWQEDIEGELDRSLARLANLARDDHEQDPSESTEQHYTRRLDGAIERQRVRYTYLQDAKSTITTLLSQNARMYSMLQFLVSEVVEDPHVIGVVVQLLADIDEGGREMRPVTNQQE